MCWAAAPFTSNSNSQVLPLPQQPVHAAGEADPVGLEAVAQAGLRDAHAGLELEGEAVEVVEQLGVELVHVGRHDPAEEDAAEAGRRVHRQAQPTQGHPAGGRDRARVEDLELGQDHAITLTTRGVAGHPGAIRVLVMPAAL